MKAKKIKFLTIVIALLLSFNATTGVFAEAVFRFGSNNTLAITGAQTNQSGDAEILREYETPRGAFEKHFIMSDDSMMAVTYSEAVYYKDGESWVAVDNSLVSRGGVYRTNNKDFNVSFAKDLRSGDIVNIEYLDYTLSWTLGIQGKERGVFELSTTPSIKIDNGEADRSASDKERMLHAGKSQTGIVYANALGTDSAMDLSYRIAYNKVKEDIIIRKETDLTSVTMRINAPGLIAVLNDDNSITFLGGEKEVIFNISAPLMYDADGAVLHDIETSLESVKNGYAVTYTPNEQWLRDEERVYPLTFDPTATTGGYTNNCVDTYVHSGDAAGDHYNETYLRVGKIDSTAHRAYLKILQFPSIATNANIFFAQLNTSLISGTTSGYDFSIYYAHQAWTETGISYANQPSTSLLVSNVPCDYARDKVDFTITSFIRAYYHAAATNHGFMIRYTNESLNDYNYLCSNEYSTASSRPMLTILYNPQNEIESNNTASSATEMSIANPAGYDSMIRGKLSSSSDVDYYMFRPQRHGRVYVGVAFPAGYMYNVELYDSQQNAVNCDYVSIDNYSYTVTYAFKALKPSSPETYYIKVSANGTVSTQNYSVVIFYALNYGNFDWVYPVNGRYRISSPVGYRSFNINGAVQTDYHKGVDIPGYESDVIYSVCSGTVIDSNEDLSMGKYVVIRSNEADPYTGEKYVITYMHLSQLLVEAGDSVGKQTPIGYMGTTGNSTGVHLHFQINDQNVGPLNATQNKDYVNPIDVYSGFINFIGDVY